MAKKYDAVIEAVHYTEDGRIGWVRVYEKMGLVFSDRLIWNRDRLVRRMKNGANIFAGKRITLMGNSFDLGEPLVLVERDGSSFVVIGNAPTEKDDLGSVPRI